MQLDIATVTAGSSRCYRIPPTKPLQINLMRPLPCAMRDKNS